MECKRINFFVLGGGNDSDVLFERHLEEPLCGALKVECSEGFPRIDMGVAGEFLMDDGRVDYCYFGSVYMDKGDDLDLGKLSEMIKCSLRIFDVNKN